MVTEKGEREREDCELVSTCLSVSISVLRLPAAPADDDHYFPGTLQEEGILRLIVCIQYSTQPNHRATGWLLSLSGSGSPLASVCVCLLFVGCCGEDCLSLSSSTL